MSEEKLEQNQSEEKGVTRRSFIKSAAFLGGISVVAMGAPELFDVSSQQQQSLLQTDTPAPGFQYSLAQPENVIYSACLMCHTHCTIKTKHQSGGVLTEIQGNPYSPITLLPWLDYSTPVDQAVTWDGKLCVKGVAGLQTLYDPYRIVKVLKRAGPRGSNKWTTISFDQAIQEIVNGGQLFQSIGENRNVAGFKQVLALRDSTLAKSMAADVSNIWGGKMTVSGFKQKYASNLGVLIDPDHPDLGPKNNQFGLFFGRAEGTRVNFMARFVQQACGSINLMNHTSTCELTMLVANQMVSSQFANGQWTYGAAHNIPDFNNTEFVIFWGTSPFEANFGPTPLSEQITKAMVENNMRIAVVDPRLSKVGSKAWKWLPVQTDGDLPLAMAMISWLLQNNEYNTEFLSNANKAAATAAGELDWTNASWLVKIENDEPITFLRASDIGLAVPSGKNASNYFVALNKGTPVAFDTNDAANAVVGDLFVNTTISGIQVKSSIQILSELSSQNSFEQWSQLAGVDPNDVEDVAAEFAAHGRKSVVTYYRGPAMHTNGAHTIQAILSLNLLVGNIDRVGGMAVPDGGWDDVGTSTGKPFNIASTPNAMTPFGVRITREGAGGAHGPFYEQTTIFNGYPAKRPWYPFGWDVYQEEIPSSYYGYPYPMQIVWLHMANHVFRMPAGAGQIQLLTDTEKIPLLIADDVVIGDTSMYADYLFPDITYLERWDTDHPIIAGVKASSVRQPTAAPVTETVTVDNQEMPTCLESAMIAIAKNLGLPGFGTNAFANNLSLDKMEDFYLKGVANIAAGDGSNNTVPDASSDEIQVFLNARKDLPTTVFDPTRWESAVSSTLWPKVIYVLNRGGRFAPVSDWYKGEFMNHSFGKLWNLYVEPWATAKNSITGESLGGAPVYRTEPTYGDNTPVSQTGYDFHLSTFKEIFTAKRTLPEYWGMLSLLPTNVFLMNAADGESLGLSSGDWIKVSSLTSPDGQWNLGPLGTRSAQGPVKLIQGIRPGTLTFTEDYGHWGYGASDVVVDGATVPHDPRRATGFAAHHVMLTDKVAPGAAIADPICGGIAWYDTKVSITKVSPQQQTVTASSST